MLCISTIQINPTPNLNSAEHLQIVGITDGIAPIRISIIIYHIYRLPDCWKRLMVLVNLLGSIRKSIQVFPNWRDKREWKSKRKPSKIQNNSIKSNRRRISRRKSRKRLKFKSKEVKYLYDVYINVYNLSLIHSFKQTEWIWSHCLHFHSRTNHASNIFYIIIDHCRSFQTQSPCNHIDIPWQS